MKTMVKKENHLGLILDIKGIVHTHEYGNNNNNRRNSTKTKEKHMKEISIVSWKWKKREKRKNGILKRREKVENTRLN